VLSRILGLKSDEARAEKLHEDELRDLYCSPIIIRIIKLKRMWYAVNVA
jgi:hypothetical protein